jgi:putative peptidoglycan lipid II flippase
MTDAPKPNAATRRSFAAAALVAAGIFSSRIVGLIRERFIATFFGAGMHADVFAAGLRMPNVLQNLLGEGTLSASFIPVYSALIGQGRTKEAGRLAGAIFALLLGIAGAISLVGIALAPFLVAVFTPGFAGERRELMIQLVRILFPMTGVLVLSAWALGILNSHRKFFIPYFAPVLWNVAILVALIAFSFQDDLDTLLIAVGWGAFVGGLLQFGVQLPWVLKLDREIRINLGRDQPAFREVLRNAGPAIMGRGVVQLSSYVDMVLASLLAVGAVAHLRYAQTLYVLPVSLFGMSVAAAELPELARERESAIGALRDRTVAAIRRVAFYVIPSAVAFILLGDVFVGGLYQAGEFTASNVALVWLTLAAYGIGLLASTTTRIYQSAFFALRDTRTPARVATLRVITSAFAGAALMLQFESVTLGGLTIPAGMLDRLTIDGIPLGPVGLALGASIGAWLEWALLRARLTKQVGKFAAGRGHYLPMLGSALLAAAAGYGVGLLTGQLHPLLKALLVGGVFGVVYFAAARTLGLSEAKVVLDSVLRKLRR